MCVYIVASVGLPLSCVCMYVDNIGYRFIIVIVGITWFFRAQWLAIASQLVLTKILFLFHNAKLADYCES